jgi:hypothetical protein
MQCVAEHSQVLVKILDKGLCLVPLLGILYAEFEPLKSLFWNLQIRPGGATSIDRLTVGKDLHGDLTRVILEHYLGAQHSR